MKIFKQCYESSQPQIEFTIEYSDENNGISIYVTYVASDFNPFENIDNEVENLGMLLISKMAGKYEHIFENNHNSIIIKL